MLSNKGTDIYCVSCFIFKSTNEHSNCSENYFNGNTVTDTEKYLSL